MCCYPVNYPILKIQNKVVEPLVARAIYSRPQKNGRAIFGELIEYGQVWRMGANEATEIEFYKEVKINGKKVPKGRYTLYAIPYPDKWTMILNRDTDTWGAFKYDEKKDVVRVDAAVENLKENLEFFSLNFEKSENGFTILAGWDNVMVSLPVTY